MTVPLQRNPGIESSLRIDARARVYLLQRGVSVEAVSFDDVVLIANALAGRLGKPSEAIGQTEVGGLGAFVKYRDLLRRAAPLLAGEIWFHPTTPTKVRFALNQAKACRRRIRIYYGDPVTGRDSLQIGDTIGWVGRSGATLPGPVLLANANDRAGMPIMDNAVVRVQDLQGHYDLYTHPTYSLPEFTVVPMSDASARILIDGNDGIDFANDGQARRWLKYVQGKEHFVPRMSGSQLSSPTQEQA